MPLRNFKCLSCNKEDQFIIESSDSIIKKCNCGGEYKKISLSYALSPNITEKVGKYWNKNLKVGLKEEMKSRSTEHMRKHEMHEIIAKNGIDNVKNHPLMKNGHIRKKGD